MKRLACVLALLTLTGCAFGPKTIERTHGRYGEAVHRVELEQALSSIVRLRYVENPVTLDVGSIATQYELAASTEFRPFWSTESDGGIFRTFTATLPFGQISGADRPTVSFLPRDDEASVERFFTPITAEKLTFLVQSGWKLSSLMRLWVEALNGVPNWDGSTSPVSSRPADYERFRWATDLLQIAANEQLVSLRAEPLKIDVSDPLPLDAVNGAAAVSAANSGLEYRRTEDGQSWQLIRRVNRLDFKVNPAAQDRAEMHDLAQLLNLQPGLTQYPVRLAKGVPDPARVPTEPRDELLVTTRCMAQAFFFLAQGVEVPAEHLKCGLARVAAGTTNPNQALEGLFRVYSMPGGPFKRPKCAFVAIHYRNHWYYIDDRDQESKATLMLMLLLRRMDFDRTTAGTGPLLTLPLGR